jgi:hypothetical protein
VAEQFFENEKNSPAKADIAALNTLSLQIEAHKKHDKKESWLARGVGYITTLNTRSDDSIKDMERLKQKASRELEKGDKQAFAATKKEIEAKIKSDRETLGWKDEVTRYGGGFAKTAALFAKGPIGVALTLGLHGAAEAKVGDSRLATLADLGLGAAKGGAMRLVFNKIGDHTMSAAGKGVTLGILNSALESGLTRQNYLDKTNGTFTTSSFRNGLIHSLSSSLDPQARALDGAIFLAGHGIFKGLDHTTGGALARSKMLSTMFTGGSFGLSSGAVGELMRQKEAGEKIDPLQIAIRGALQAGTDSLAAGFGHAASDPHVHGRIRSFTEDNLSALRESFKHLQREANERLDRLVGPGRLAAGTAGGDGLIGYHDDAHHDPRNDYVQSTTRPEPFQIGDRMHLLAPPRAGASPYEWLEPMKEALIKIDDMPVDAKIEPLREIWKHLEQFDMLPVNSAYQADLLLEVDRRFNDQMRGVQTEARKRALEEDQKIAQKVWEPGEQPKEYYAPGKLVADVIRERLERTYLWQPGTRAEQTTEGTGSVPGGIKAQSELFNELANLVTEGLHKQPRMLEILEQYGVPKRRAMEWVGVHAEYRSGSDHAGGDFLLINRTTGEIIPLDSTLHGLNVKEGRLVDNKVTNPDLAWDSDKYVSPERTNWLLCVVNPNVWNWRVLELSRASGVPSWGRAMDATREQFRQELTTIIAHEIANRSPLNVFGAMLPSTDADLPPSRTLYELWRFRAELERQAGMHQWADDLKGGLTYILRNQMPRNSWGERTVGELPLGPRSTVKKYRPS